MSFAPPTPDRASTPRSTPIPGTESDTSGTLGNIGAVPPPSPSQFVNGAPGARSPFGPTFQSAPGAEYATPKRGRSWGGFVLVGVLAVGPVIGIGVGIWAFTRAKDASDQADRILDDAELTLSTAFDDAQETLDTAATRDSITDAGPDDVMPAAPAPVPVDPATSLPVAVDTTSAPPAAPTVNLFADGGAPTLIASFDAAISGEPSRLMQVMIYPDYAFATAQDANNPVHVDEYPWRAGVVGTPSPVTLMGDGDLESNLFSATEVDWSFIARAVAEAPSLMPTVEAGVVTHIIVERSVFTADFSVVVRVYVSGPRGGGYAEYTPTGQFVQAVV